MYGKIIGIVGLGGIGTAIAERLVPFKLSKILYTSRKKKETNIAEFATFNDVIKDSDVIVITCALNEETKGMFNKKVFEKMKNTSVLINVSRGAVVQQDDLLEALKVIRVTTLVMHKNWIYNNFLSVMKCMAIFLSIMCARKCDCSENKTSIS